MIADGAPLIAGALIFLASLFSLRFGLSVAIVEILFGVAAGNFLGLQQPEAWMTYLAGFGGIVLTFLAGAEVDLGLLRAKAKESLWIGGASFVLPFLGGFAYGQFVAGWTLQASLLAGIALSANSIAVVYSVLVETGLVKSGLGKTLMAATFVTNMGTALALSLVFLKPDFYTLEFAAVSVLLVGLAARFSGRLFGSRTLKDKVIEPEIKYLFLLLLTLIYFANQAGSQAILPAFVLGLCMAPHFAEKTGNGIVKSRLRTVAYALITPFFFLLAGMRVSLPLVLASAGTFAALFAVKEVTKFVGAFVPAKRFLPRGKTYVSLLMSTGLTFGTIASVFGLQAGYIDQAQFSVLIAVEIASAVLPTIVAEKWFRPAHLEDPLGAEAG